MDVLSYYGLIGLGVDKVHIQVLLLARDWQVGVIPPHYAGLLLLGAA